MDISFPTHATIPFVADPWEDGDKHIDVEEIRPHIRRLSDFDLLRASPNATWGKAARLVFRVQGWVADNDE